MSLRVMSHLASQALIAADTDEVILAWPVPQGAKINGCWLSLSLVNATAVSLLTATFYGVHGFILPIADPEAGTTVDVTWDAVVPKSELMGTTAATDALDLDPSSAEGEMVLEPGELNLNRLAGGLGEPENVFSRLEMLTWPKTRALGHLDTTLKWVPTDYISTKVEKNYSVVQNSYLAFGVSSPTGDQTSADFFTPASSQEWLSLKYMLYTLERLYLWMTGLSEAGAETPFVEAARLVEGFLSKVNEETAGTFFQGVFTVIAQGTMDITVPGEFEMGILTTGY